MLAFVMECLNVYHIRTHKKDTMDTKEHEVAAIRFTIRFNRRLAATSILQKSPLGAEVVVEAGAGGHGLSVEVRGEGAVLHTMNTSEFRTRSY
jgi:hypothetical protein